MLLVFCGVDVDEPPRSPRLPLPLPAPPNRLAMLPLLPDVPPLLVAPAGGSVPAAAAAAVRLAVGRVGVRGGADAAPAPCPADAMLRCRAAALPSQSEGLTSDLAGMLPTVLLVRSGPRKALQQAAPSSVPRALQMDAHRMFWKVLELIREGSGTFWKDQ